MEKQFPHAFRELLKAELLLAFDWQTPSSERWIDSVEERAAGFMNVVLHHPPEELITGILLRPLLIPVPTGRRLLSFEEKMSWLLRDLATIPRQRDKLLSEIDAMLH